MCFLGVYMSSIVGRGECDVLLKGFMVSFDGSLEFLVRLAGDRCLLLVYVVICGGLWGFGSALVSALVWGFDVDFMVFVFCFDSYFLLVLGGSYRLGDVFTVVLMYDAYEFPFKCLIYE